jgi:hypothetical protein
LADSASLCFQEQPAEAAESECADHRIPRSIGRRRKPTSVPRQRVISSAVSVDPEWFWQKMEKDE